MSRAITSKDFLAMVTDKAPQPRGNKFNARKVGEADSGHEKNWITKLLYLQREGYIANLKSDKRELRYELKWNGVWICQYTADAAFDVVKDFEIPTFDGKKALHAGEFHLLDAKSNPTRKKRDYILVKNMMLAAHQIKILEV